MRRRQSSSVLGQCGFVPQKGNAVPFYGVMHLFSQCPTGFQLSYSSLIIDDVYVNKL